MQQLRRAQLRIDLDALKHNFQVAKQAAPNSKIMAVIKANAYGHDMLKVAQVLTDADGFAVATIGEGLALRKADISKTILILQGASNAQEYQRAAEQRLTLSIHHNSQLSIFNQHKGEHPSLWLKFDTGMHRLGFPVGLAEELINELGEKVTGLMMHFACADEPENPANQQQIHAFQQATDSFNLPRSAANSAAILKMPQTHFDWVRPGIMLYGASPLLNVTGQELNLKPVMTLAAPLIAINLRKKGEAVGYGADYICPEDMPIGVIAIGYGDGYPRHAPSGTPVLINGVECPLAGRVSMDMSTVDLRSCPSAKVGDHVELWGKDLSVCRIAEMAGTISYELLCAMPACGLFVNTSHRDRY